MAAACGAIGQMMQLRAGDQVSTSPNGRNYDHNPRTGLGLGGLLLVSWIAYRISQRLGPSLRDHLTVQQHLDEVEMRSREARTGWW